MNALNLFILPLDNRREWFRYHQLFAQLLRKRLLDTEGGEAVTGLKQAASRWYAEHGHIVEAVEMVLESGDFDQAANLIERFGPLLFTGAALNALQKWTESLPETILSARPRLLVMAAWANHATGYPDRAAQFVRLLERTAVLNVDEFLTTLSEPDSLSSILQYALLEGAVVLTRIAVDSLDLERAFTLAEKTLPYLVPIPPEEPYAFNLPIALRCAQLFNQGVAYKFKGDLDRAAAGLAEFASEAQIAQNPHIIALALGHLGEIQMMQGDLGKARIYL